MNVLSDGHVCVFSFACVRVCVCEIMSVSIYVHVCVFICICLCVCVCVRVVVPELATSVHRSGPLAFAMVITARFGF